MSNKHIAPALIFTFLLPACSVFSSDDNFTRIVPDNTIFIASVLETTVDTVHHYPEVYVGSVVHEKDKYAITPGREVMPGIWWPMLNAQVNKTPNSFDLVRTDINDADVTITGPLGSEKEKAVTFENEGLGVYGDVNYELELLPNERYRLDVVLPDQRHYKAETVLPGLIEWEVPAEVEVELTVSKTGSTETGEDIYREENDPIDSIQFEYKIPEHGWMTTLQINNSDDDPDNLLQVTSAEPFDGFQYGDRGPYLRDGATYMIITNSNPNVPPVMKSGPRWSKNSLVPLLDSRTAWMRVSQMNEDLSRRWFYQNVFVSFGAIDGEPWLNQSAEQALAKKNEDTNYLFRISNIQKLGENGDPVSADELDAIGVFGGFSSAYRKIKMIPIRSWDPDTLNWAR